MIVKKVPNPKKSASKAQRIGQLTSYVRSPESESPQEKCLYAGARGVSWTVRSESAALSGVKGLAPCRMSQTVRSEAPNGQAGIGRNMRSMCMTIRILYCSTTLLSYQQFRCTGRTLQQA